MKILPAKIEGEITIVSSKSLSHRYMIAAGLAQGTSIINNLLVCDDLKATADALTNLGAVIDEARITGSQLEVKQTVVNCGQSGSTIRFLIPLYLLTSTKVQFVGQNLLLHRPFETYLKTFLDHDVLFEHKVGEYIIVKGPLTGGVFHLDADVSSQFLSGLLMALPLVKKDSKIILTTPLTSEGYVNLTLKVLKEFGIDVVKENNTFLIKGNQQYQSQKLTVEGDYSQAAFFIAAALLRGSISINQLNPFSQQGDQEILNIVAKMGGKFIFKNNVLKVFQSKLKGCSIDLENIPDLGPILMVLAAFSKGWTTFLNVHRLKHKESDRLEAMITALKWLKIKYRYKDNILKIKGQSVIEGGVTLSTFKDHRIAMALTILGLNTIKGIELDDVSCVSKSFPTFYELLNSVKVN